MNKKRYPSKKNKKVQQKSRQVPVEKKLTQKPVKEGNRYAYLILLVLSFLIYSNTLFFDYTLDDRMIITNNEFTKKGFEGMGEILTNDAFTGFFGKQKKLVAGGRYRPLSQLMFAVEYEIFGEKPFVGHLLNVIIYMLTAVVLFKTLKLLLRDFRFQKWYLSLPFIASIIFIVHPIHTEVVANIKGRDEMLSFLGAILSLYFVLKYTDQNKSAQLIWAGISMFLAMLAKENAITFLAVIPLALFFFRKVKAGNYIISFLPLFIAVIVYMIMRYNALGYLLSSEKVMEILNNPYARSTTTEKLATIFYTWLLYLKLLVFPHPLTHDYYPFHIAITNFSDPFVLFSVILYLGLGIYAILKLKTRYLLSFSILFFFVTFSISSNLVFNIGTFMNERFLYGPSLGMALAVAFVIGIKLKEWISKSVTYQNYALVILVVLCLAGIIRSFSRNFAWKDDYTLFTTDVKTSENSTKCNVSAGEAILRRAQEITNREEQRGYFERASKHFSKAVEIYPGNLGGWHLNGTTLTNLGMYSEALVCYENALKLQPDEGKVAIFLNEVDILARNAYAKKELQNAENAFLLLQKYQPENLEYKILLADVYASGNRINDGVTMLVELTEKHPDNFLAFNKLGRIYGEKLQDLQKSLFYLNKAYDLKKDDPSTLENLGIVYAMLQQYPQSIEFFEKALEISPGNARLLNNLGNTYMAVGEKEKAEACFAEARKNQ